MSKKIYWAICIIAAIASAIYAPMHVNYEWGIGAYIAVGWFIFLLIFGLIALFADKIKTYFDNKG